MYLLGDDYNGSDLRFWNCRDGADWRNRSKIWPKRIFLENSPGKNEASWKVEAWYQYCIDWIRLSGGICHVVVTSTLCLWRLGTNSAEVCAAGERGCISWRPWMAKYVQEKYPEQTSQRLWGQKYQVPWAWGSQGPCMVCWIAV